MRIITHKQKDEHPFGMPVYKAITYDLKNVIVRIILILILEIRTKIIVYSRIFLT